MRVYIAGPYSSDDPQDVERNVQIALVAADLLANAGAEPFVPHLSHFWEAQYPRPYEDWLRIDNAWVVASHLVVRLAGPSAGADAEVKLAQENGITVMSLEDALAYVTSVQAGTEALNALPVIPPE